MKRRRSSTSTSKSFVTADSQNSASHHTPPASLRRQVSPPPLRRASTNSKSAAALVEAGEAVVEDHVAFFASKLLNARKPEIVAEPRLLHDAWLDLYNRNLNDQGHHFVIHQHDHPAAGTHYDLRLQCNSTSSISFAIMYGLPGDPNSRRLNRNATETRVHNLWNHLTETASTQTGTMLIWDTGEYQVLPHQKVNGRNAASDSDSDPSPSGSASITFDKLSEPEKLAHAFQRRKIHLRLHGTRLPATYTISLRLTTENFRSAQPAAPSFRRRGKSQTNQKLQRRSSTSSSSSSHGMPSLHRTVYSLQATASPPSSPPPAASQEENDRIRATNAYPGATNSIGSIHQRKWFLSLDRSACGFVQTHNPPVGHHAKTYWIRPSLEGKEEKKGGFDRFHVLGRDVERSVVTGRLAKDILQEEGVENYVPRGKWRAVVE
jgi:DNA polymerase Ligase (LigD)